MGLVVDRIDDAVTVLRLDRPDRRNAVDLPLVDALLDAFDALDARAVVLSSTDERWFCAGADLSIPDTDRAQVSDRLYELYSRMIRLPVPIVAAIGGPAVGGGAQLAVASDLRIAGPDAWFRFAGAGHGLAVGAWALPSVVGRGRAIDLCLTMRDVRADEARAIGLVDRIIAPPEAAAIDLATAFGGLDAAAVARVKAVTSQSVHLAESLASERRGNGRWAGAIPG